MTPLYCSLYLHEDLTGPLLVEPGGYHLVRFPYGGHAESSDEHGMHQPEQPDGSIAAFADDRSALIWPAADGVGLLEANVHWEAGDYTEVRERFVRDPLGAADSTGTDHRPPSPGMQCVTKMHQIKVSRTTPLGLMVHHNASEPRRLIHAQFKLTIFPEA